MKMRYRHWLLLACVLIGTLFSSLAHAVETYTWQPGWNLLQESSVGTVGGITVTATGSRYTPNSGTASMLTRINAGQGLNGAIHMLMDATTATRWTQVTLTFSRPVTGLEFTVADIDGGTGYVYNDHVQVTSTPAQTPSILSQGSQVSWIAGTRTAQSTSNTNLTNTNGNIRFRFPQQVTQVTIRYISAAANQNPSSSQEIFIGDLSWESGEMRVRKTTTGGVGGPFAFSQVNLLTTPGNITTTVAGSPAPASPAAHEIGAPGTNVTVTESPASGWTVTAASCTDANSAVTGNAGTFGTLSGSTVTVNAAALTLSGSNITCTFTNARSSILRLRKELPNGRSVAGNQFTLRIANGATILQTATTTGTTNTPAQVATLNPALAGTTYTLSEIGAGSPATVLSNYTSTYSCTNALAGGQTPSGGGTSFTVTPVAGDDLTCTLRNAIAPPSFGTCDARMFLDSTAAGSTQLSLLNTSTSAIAYTPIGAASTLTYDAIGYNPLDNYIYGVEYAGGGVGNELYRIGSDGSVQNLGLMTLSTGGSFPNVNVAGGAFSPTGEFYVSSRETGRLYRVDLVTRVATPVSSNAVMMEIIDFAFIGNLLYGPMNDGQLARVDPATGNATVIGTAAGGMGAPSVWGTSNGGLYSLDNDGRMHQWDIVTGAKTLIATGQPAPDADGTNCPAAPLVLPADLSVTKTNTPASGPNDLSNDTFVPGETRTYSIVVSNGSSSFGAQNITVSDPVPAGIDAATVSWTCANTSGGSRCGAASGTGALNDTGLDLPPNAVATYLVTMTVPTTFTGNLTNTVTITPPGTIGDTNTGNNTATDTDTRATADVAVVKSASTATASAGEVVNYTIVATNQGPNDLSDVLLSDVASAGHDCTLPSSTATCIAAGGASCPAAAVPVSSLLGSGIVIATLPVGGQVTVSLQCTITASGL